MSPAFTDNDGRLDWRKIGYHARSVFAVLLSLTVLVGGGWFVYSKAHDAYIAWRTTDDYIGDGAEEAQVLIPRGASLTQMGDLLTEAGVVRSTKAFRNAARESGQADKIQAGRYRLKKQLPAETVVAMLLDSKNLVLLEVVFPEGTTNAEQFDIIADKTGLSLEDIQAATVDTTQYPLPAYANGALEGFLFPAKYQVAEPPVAAAVLSTQVKQFNTIAEKINLEGVAAESGLAPLDVVTTASIIASEVKKPADQPMVAAVIYNRLAAGMKLEMDSTVHFAVGKKGSVTTTAEERATDSPYNTYVYPGLPPGPISNPGQTALEAALSPADTDALYFVTVDLDTGETRFAATLPEHEANVKLFQQWCSDHQGRC